eukprot:CAMPEP_0115001056 /NCGR_PEP_ID=MMETSP0216-20121206/17140_1 /TAXON_ID=223996 /ORGANISM="Protocruzia adherens, Strain Boccale" /LENGTH=349 /DNA_ID=CAMNT_0002366301 /DNA_START=114 /DNA_END=1163 /DNA_ORIENTATION=-
MIVSRSLTGMSEAAFMALSVPIINKIAPEGTRAKWCAAWVMMSPVGYAVGFIYGQTVEDITNSIFWPFRIESALMTPLVLFSILPYTRNKLRQFLATAEPRPLQSSSTQPLLPSQHDHQHHQQQNKPPSFTKDIFQLFQNTQYLFLILGISVFNFSLGGLSFWGNDYIEQHFSMNKEHTVIIFGVLTVFCGISGSLFGGYLQDRVLVRGGLKDKDEIVCACCKFITVNFLCGAVAGLVGYAVDDIWMLTGGLFAMEMFLYVTNGPLIVAIVNSVEQRQQGLAMAIMNIASHVLGDVPAPTIVGSIKDSFSFKTGMLFLMVWLFFGPVCYGLAWKISAQKVRKAKSIVKT